MLIQPNSFIFNLGVATILSIIIGLERELKKKPLGLKTCLVIGIVSCLLTSVSIEASEKFAEAYIKPMDPLRLSAQIVSGIGFLGAGVILRRNNDMISGLTTAALVWGAGGIGIACGAGFWFEASVATILLFVSVEIIPFIIKFIGPKSLREKELKVKIIVNAGDKMTDILKDLKKNKMKARKIKVRDIEQGELQQLELVLLVNEKLYLTDLYYTLKQIDHVIKVEMESL
ncbi:MULTISPECIES: MgtC/SapB family protein [Metabacillus]|jgi:putative Mg2+ transporter-C (MgtC) family protein|uniref:MgtC/SapB family protein n=1 Tax=Metabacillus rhizolycopersici TaxID=2875709 RepID=A0ABS7URX0_9BACI|nr:MULTISPECIES: MgtC/SapB family protein [Metabacillus]MBZ5751033.1 MgtC/SapB family protein [Metabacillus rhizolycopersici]MCM3651854.1 MgtC/SapB family protein [Metabacillus litoralis]